MKKKKKKPKDRRCYRCRNNLENRPCPICYPDKVMKKIEEKLGYPLGNPVKYELLNVYDLSDKYNAKVIIKKF